MDEIYDALFVNRTKDLGIALGAFDRNVIDGLGVNGAGWLTRLDFEYFRGVGQVGRRRPCESERVDRARRRRSDALFADGTFFDVRNHDRDGCDRAVELLPAPDSHSGALKARRKRWGSFTITCSALFC